MKKLLTPVCLILCIVVSAISCYDLLRPEKTVEREEKKVLRLWNVDSFEGGKGSRTEFLSRAAVRFEKGRELYIIVSSMTYEGCKYELERGNIPDMLSFGVGSYSLNPLKIGGKSFSPSGKDGECYAYPWCRGGYVLYSLTDDFSDVNGDNTVISSGGGIPELAAALHGLKGDFTLLPPTSAYVRFLKGEYKYMLGTQRDVYRFKARNAGVFAEPLAVYSDLYQYISILNGENYGLCQKFIEFLTGEAVQTSLYEIGMLSVCYPVYSADETIMSAMEKVRIEYTLPPLLQKDTIGTLKELAGEILSGGEIKNIKNYLKTVA